MAKRTKRAKKGVESITKEIEKHFKKLEEDIREGNIDRGRYHFKELDKSLLTSLQIKLDILDYDDRIVKVYRKRLGGLRKKLL